MAKVYISIGSNIDPHRYIRLALQALNQQYTDIECSRVYQSTAVGFSGDDFLNLVVGFETQQSIQEIVDVLHAIEDRYGRDRSAAKFSSRSIDLDLLLYDDLVFEQGKIQIPRHEITKNAFVLLPLCEIAPQLIHPLLNVSMQQLWDEFDQASQQLHMIDFNF